MNSKVKVAVLFSFVLNISCNSIDRLYINYGTVKKQFESANSDVAMIFFDRKGNMYPDYPIDDSFLRASDSRLEQYYENDSVTYNAICKQYNLKPDIHNLSVTNSPLQEALISRKASQLNYSEKELFFIIHGYNEHPSKPDDDSSSMGMKKTKEWIESHYPNRFLFVEVYWDGLSRQNGNKILLYNPVYIWDNAQASASNTGFELRRLFSKLNKKKKYVLTHSLGASVITTALFNVEKLKNAQLNELKMKFENPVYNSPSQEFHIGMIAPAIPGENTFLEYHNRTIKGKNIRTTDSNYFFITGFNSYDPVNSKGYSLSRFLGSTTLGCKRNELEKTRRIFMNEDFIFDYEDFSYFDGNRKQRSHSWLKYIENNFHFKNFAEKLIE
ncbi:hypothetical protein [Flavobacterium sp. GT3P67]|uniref:hypothetical protein n=1 Tax=Flavobacterium sp. GT3P67 TaxID=2541722 RepID=UPI00104E5099|nr:hypothetical protein [Flavobacterium sp. GT3P67]TDE52716.1 hypothetical protein E0H99_11375 [Flavobacterium sp. GT3P67]